MQEIRRILHHLDGRDRTRGRVRGRVGFPSLDQVGPFWISIGIRSADIGERGGEMPVRALLVCVLALLLAACSWSPTKNTTANRALSSVSTRALSVSGSRVASTTNEPKSTPSASSSVVGSPPTASSDTSAASLASQGSPNCPIPATSPAPVSNSDAVALGLGGKWDCIPDFGGAGSGFEGYPLAPEMGVSHPTGAPVVAGPSGRGAYAYGSPVQINVMLESQLTTAIDVTQPLQVIVYVTRTLPNDACGGGASVPSGGVVWQGDLPLLDGAIPSRGGRVSYTFSWNQKNKQGQQVAPGTYYMCMAQPAPLHYTVLGKPGTETFPVILQGGHLGQYETGGALIAHQVGTVWTGNVTGAVSATGKIEGGGYDAPASKVQGQLTQLQCGLAGCSAQATLTPATVTTNAGFKSIWGSSASVVAIGPDGDTPLPTNGGGEGGTFNFTFAAVPLE